MKYFQSIGKKTSRPLFVALSTCLLLGCGSKSQDNAPSPTQTQTDITEKEDLDPNLESNQELEQKILELSDVHFNQLTDDQLSALIKEDPRIGESFHRDKAEIARLQNQIEQETLSIQNDTKRVQDEINRQFNINEDLFRNLEFVNEPMDMEVITQTSVPETDATRLLREAGDQTVTILKSARERGNNFEFLIILKGWNDFHSRISNALRGKDSNPKTDQSLNRIKEQVSDYAKTQLDENGFFRSAKIPENTKRIIGILMRNREFVLIENLKEELNTWNDSLNPAQQSVIDAITLLEPVAIKFQDLRSSLPDLDPKSEKAENSTKEALKKTIENLIKAAREAGDDQMIQEALDEYLVRARMGSR